MKPLLSSLRRKLSSLELTLILLGLSMALVFFGTLDQVEFGLRNAQERYFESFFAFWSYPPSWPLAPYFHWLRLGLPGGYLLGSLLLLNLSFSLTRYLRRGYQGLLLVHTGLMLLLISGFGMSLFQTESQLLLEEGQAKNYSEDPHTLELALVDHSDPENTLVAVIDFKHTRVGQNHTPEGLLHICILERYENTRLLPTSPQHPTYSHASQGLASSMPVHLMPLSKSYKDEAPNENTLLVALYDGPTPLGTWLLHPLLHRNFPPQTLTHQGKTYSIALRPKRHYTPYWLQLKTFTQSYYPGTQIPKSFSSQVSLFSPPHWQESPVCIAMNTPLRTHQTSYYQASYSGQSTSILQVVHNPGWTLPYWSLALIASGLCWHFVMSLIRYMKVKKG